LFRFPYLSDSRAMITYLPQPYIGIFSIDADAYDNRTRDGATVHRTIIRLLLEKRRGIILFHDIQPSTAKALKGLLEDIQARGFRVVHFVHKAPATTLPLRRTGGKGTGEEAYCRGSSTVSVGIGAGLPKRQRAPARARPASEMTRLRSNFSLSGYRRPAIASLVNCASFNLDGAGFQFLLAPIGDADDRRGLLGDV
jgi:hypothetical protein